MAPMKNKMNTALMRELLSRKMPSKMPAARSFSQVVFSERHLERFKKVGFIFKSTRTNIHSSFNSLNVFITKLWFMKTFKDFDQLQIRSPLFSQVL